MLSLEQLRGRVGRTPAPRGQGTGVRVVVAEPEIGQLDVHVRVQEQVFGFEVSVDDPVGVAVVDGREDLGEHVAGLELSHSAMIDLESQSSCYF